MADAFAVCESAGILKITDEQPKYFGAYIFSHMMTPYHGMSANIGRASSDFFKSVVGYDHFNYYWGWRGEDPTVYGVGTNGFVEHRFRKAHRPTNVEAAVATSRARGLAASCNETAVGGDHTDT